MATAKSGRQYDKQHAVTIVAAVALASNRFVAFDGGYPAAGGGAKDAQGVTEYAADAGDAVSAITGYSALVEAGGAIAAYAFVKADATGKAVTGAANEHCGRALGAATAAGQLVEVQVLKAVAPGPT